MIATTALSDREVLVLVDVLNKAADDRAQRVPADPPYLRTLRALAQLLHSSTSVVIVHNG